MNKLNTVGLAQLLADEYLLQIKTQNFHWNVEGPLFFSLHKLFEEQYDFISEKVDTIAERIRALNTRAPGGYAEFLKLATIKDAPQDKVSAMQMIEILTEDHTTLSKRVSELHEAAEKNGDTGTVVILEDLIVFHEKAAWMIRSHR